RWPPRARTTRRWRSCSAGSPPSPGSPPRAGRRTSTDGPAAFRHRHPGPGRLDSGHRTGEDATHARPVPQTLPRTARAAHHPDGRADLVQAAVPETNFTFEDMAATPDGGVVVVGHTGFLMPNDISTRLIVVKLTADGQRDEAFDANTATIAGFGPEASGSSDA